ncbi:hypothetical protein ACFPC0_16700 [Streptomyces andamanensis]|uniref:Uncharacterized protein n=1 Tax=Streptomyces andamanensis TaxID=1565035 RepID=A0ABV8TFF1_9ACTN
MSDFQDRDAVHQVVFRWDGNHGRQGTGMNAVARSCSPERAAELGRELGPLLWMSGAAARPSVVRTVSSDGHVMLVQRWPTTDPGGRPSTVSHVLVGPPGTLKTRQCLGLAHGGWSTREQAERASGHKSVVDAAELNDLAIARLPDMLGGLPEVRHALTQITAELLRDPTQRVSLLLEERTPIAWPDRAAVPLVYLGLFLLFGSWLGHEWTFATYDTTDTHPLRLTAVPRWETDTGGSGPLARVMGRRPDDPHFGHEAAAQLVKYLLAHPDGPPGVPHLLDDLPDGRSLDWPLRRAHLRDILDSRLVAPRPAPRSVPPARLEPRERDARTEGNARDDRDERDGRDDRDERHGRGDRSGGTGRVPRDGAIGEADRPAPAAPAAPTAPAGPAAEPDRFGRTGWVGGRAPTALPGQAGPGPAGSGPARPGPTGSGPAGHPGSAPPPSSPPSPPLPTRPPGQTAAGHFEAHPPASYHPTYPPGPAPAPAPAPGSAATRPPVPGDGPAPGGAGVPAAQGASYLSQVLRDRRPGDDQWRDTLASALREQPDEFLLDELRFGELPQSSLGLLLTELGKPRRWKKRREEMHHQLCVEALDKNLYFGPQGPGAEEISLVEMTERAVAVFHWAVAPWARDVRYFQDLQRLLHTMDHAQGIALGNWLSGAFLKPRGHPVPDLPPALWQQVLGDVLQRDSPAGTQARLPSRETEGGAAPPSRLASWVLWAIAGTFAAFIGLVVLLAVG